MFAEAELLKLFSHRMPFGKYQGRRLADLPGQYLNWMAREGFPKGKLGQLLALMHEIDHNGLSSLLDPLRPHAAQDDGNSPIRSKGRTPAFSRSTDPEIR